MCYGILGRKVSGGSRGILTLLAVVLFTSLCWKILGLGLSYRPPTQIKFSWANFPPILPLDAPLRLTDHAPHHEQRQPQFTLQQQTYHQTTLSHTTQQTQELQLLQHQQAVIDSKSSESNNITLKVNYTSCPECFIPMSSHIASNVKEVPSRYSPLLDGPPEYYTPKNEIVQNLMTNYLIAPSDDFHKDCPYLLALQMSILDRKSERDSVRSTWGSVAKTKSWPNHRLNAEVKVLFVVAHQAESKSNESSWAEINLEAKQHNDILFIDMQDSYWNLTLKILSSFAWVKTSCPCVKFVLKVDQDTFVNVPLLVDSLLHLEKKFEFALGGYVYTRQGEVWRSGKWAVSPDIYPMNFYPMYLSGCAYLLDFKVVSKMVDVAPYVQMFSVEDAFITGVLRRVINCKMFTFSFIFTNFADRNWSVCDLVVTNRKIAGTGVDQAKAAQIWEMFVKNVTSC